MSQPKERHETGTETLIALGSNATSDAGTPTDTIMAALRALQTLTHCSLKISKFYRTPAFPPGSGPDFVNAAVRMSSPKSATCTLQELHAIERRFGRRRDERWAPRTLDLDLIAWGSSVFPDCDTLRRWMDLPLDLQKTEAPDTLLLPHPRMHERAFVLVPLCDVAPDWRHPVLGLTIAEMTDRLSDTQRAEVEPLATPKEGESV